MGIHCAIEGEGSAFKSVKGECKNNKEAKISLNLERLSAGAQLIQRSPMLAVSLIFVNSGKQEMYTGITGYCSDISLPERGSSSDHCP